MDQRQQTPNRHMWSADVAALSVDGWQPNEDAVVMRSERLVTNVPPDTVEQCRPGICASQFVLDALRHVKPMKHASQGRDLLR